MLAGVTADTVPSVSHSIIAAMEMAADRTALGCQLGKASVYRCYLLKRLLSQSLPGKSPVLLKVSLSFC